MIQIDATQSMTNILIEAGIENPKLDAQLLLAHVLGVSREAVMFDPPELSDAQQAEFERLVKRRAAREPISHLLGMREFYGREFRVTKDVLDPRPDTETLIASVLESRIKNQESRKDHSNILDSKFSILDLGTGSGCIIITLLKEIEGASGVGLDISDDALKVAFANKMHHDLMDRLDLVHGDMSDIFKENSVLSGDRFDIIVSNPPYIPTNELTGLMPEVRDYEPNIALDGGKDGLDYYRKLAKSSHQLLRPNGLIFLEIGAGQTNDVADIFCTQRWQLQDVRKDLGGHERCMSFKHQTV